MTHKPDVQARSDTSRLTNCSRTTCVYLLGSPVRFPRAPCAAARARAAAAPGETRLEAAGEHKQREPFAQILRGSSNADRNPSHHWQT